MYDYNWHGFGLLLTGFSGGRTVWLQGDDAASLYDELESLGDRRGPCGTLLVDILIGEYEHIAE